jgi:hypothetical protein
VGNVKLVCKSPATIGCSASPAEGEVSPGNPLRSVLNLQTTSLAAVPRHSRQGVLFAVLLPLLALAASGRRRRRALLLLIAAACACFLLSCGGGGSSGGNSGGGPPGDNTYSVQVQVQTNRGTDTLTIDLAKLTINVHH